MQYTDKSVHRQMQNTSLDKERERERERETERESSHFGSSAAPFAWGLVLPSCIGGGAGGLTWIVTPGEPARFPQRCLSLTSAAVCLSGPFVLSAPPDP